MSIIPFTSTEANLSNAGGKGTNLARLARAGFNVPKGFIISTDSYREYVSTNRLGTFIHDALVNLNSKSSPEELENASAQIRSAFSAGQLTEESKNQIQESYCAMDNDHPVPVAVRSSATAEDLPDLSFAGQQDTYLNITSKTQLFEAVTNCWSSLWTARAIGYRTRNNIPHDEAALAVVVQMMVMSDISGVLFTANPLTGLLSESVIDATFGLGEALVSGQIVPDHFVVDAVRGEIIETFLGTKSTSTRSKAGGGVENVSENVEEQQTLSEEQLQVLAAVGQDIQKEFGAPQDIEWAFADGELYILQSRAITSLFPVPQVSFDPLIVWFSFSAVQGLVGPMTPIGLDGVRYVASNAGRMFGIKPDPDNFTIFAPAGQRIWVKISDLIRHPIGNHIFDGALGFVEPSVAQIMQPLAADPRLGAGKGKLKFSTMIRLLQFGLPVLARLAGNMLHPDTARAGFDTDIESYLAGTQIAPSSDPHERLLNITATMRDRMAGVLAYLLPRFIPIFGPSMAGLNFLNRFSPQLALEVTRGLPNNVTTEMDLALWETAQKIKVDATSAADFNKIEASDLAQRYLEGNLPDVAQTTITSFMNKYGMRGVGEIDFGQPRWREDPTPVIHTLQSYLQIDPQFAPDVLFKNGERAAMDAIEQLAEIARNQHGGWLKEKLVRAFAHRIRLLMGARESPKFLAIRTMGIARQALLEVGQELANAGIIEQANDLIFLTLAELDELARHNAPAQGWKAHIAERRTAYEREIHRRQVPRVLISDGRAYYDGIGVTIDTADIINGSPVSPGVVEGIVHVVLDPRGTQLTPGEILVCPGTDPAWTPLFMAAGGLVTEVGGMMTHGSVVAREYGIPAVVGVHQATLKLKDGQRVRVDGTAGKIFVMEDGS